MISALNPSDRQFLNNLNRLGTRMQTSQRQISTGVRLERVSDDPNQVARLLQVRTGLSSVAQTLTNLSRIKAEVDSGETSLQTAVELFERARTLAADGVTGTQTATNRSLIAHQVEGIIEQLVGLAGTSTDGRFIFSGDSDQQIPYTIDWTQANPISGYLGTAATRTALHPAGNTFSLSHTAQEIFDSADPATNVFGSLLSLRSALLANDEPAIQAANDGLSKVGEYLNSQLAYYGLTQNRVSEATDFGQNLQVQLQAQLAGLQDADLTESILELNQTQTQQQASLQARAQMPRTTLFDYLG